MLALFASPANFS
jgi:hypothetical protein